MFKFSNSILLVFISLLLLQACSTTKKISQPVAEEFINGDALPDAPELSIRGNYKIGVRTLSFVNNNQLDVLRSKAGIDSFYNRVLKVEIWYPAIVPIGTKELVTYDEVMGVSNDPKRPLLPFQFFGRALRDAVPLSTGKSFPLIIVSHGYLGSRLLLTYLTENIASKGYVVVAIDHAESTYRDAGGFESTLLNRSKDILFILDQVHELSKPGSRNFLASLADADNTGLIGYSMGGYGVLNASGAGYSELLVKTFSTIARGSKAIEVLSANNENYKQMYDSRIKAVVAFAPWGMQRGVWDAKGLEGLKIPLFFVAGSQDDISGYEKGIKAIYTGAIHSDRYLLTYENARHNVAPNPPPPQSLKPGLHFDEYYRYAEPAWNERRINNINQHFVTAFLGIYLKKEDFRKYVELTEKSNLKDWNGFKPRTAVGLELLHAAPVK